MLIRNRRCDFSDREAGGQGKRARAVIRDGNRSGNLKSDRVRMEFSWIFDFGSVRIANAMNLGFRKSDFSEKIFRSRIELHVNANDRFSQIVLKLRIVESQLCRAPFRSFRTHTALSRITNLLWRVETHPCLPTS